MKHTPRIPFARPFIRVALLGLLLGLGAALYWDAVAAVGGLPVEQDGRAAAVIQAPGSHQGPLQGDWLAISSLLVETETESDAFSPGRAAASQQNGCTDLRQARRPASMCGLMNRACPRYLFLCVLRL